MQEQVYYPLESIISSKASLSISPSIDTVVNSIIIDNDDIENNENSSKSTLGIDESTLSLLHEAKEGLGKIMFRSEYSYSNLRSICNYYEQLAKGPDLHSYRKKCFINRSAMKLVNLDYAYDLIQLNNNGNNNRFTFVDLAGGPGNIILSLSL